MNKELKIPEDGQQIDEIYFTNEPCAGPRKAIDGKTLVFHTEHYGEYGIPVVIEYQDDKEIARHLYKNLASVYWKQEDNNE